MAGFNKDGVHPSALNEVTVHSILQKPGKSRSDYVYVNSAYVGSTSNVNQPPRERARRVEPPTTVIREQYWACSRWGYGQRLLAISVGVLLGACIGLGVTLALIGSDSVSDSIGGIFRNHPAPD